MAINIKHLDQENDVIEIFPAGSDTIFLENKYIRLPKDLLALIYQCVVKGSVGTLFSTGLPARLMKVDQPKWQKGRVEITIEFIPDETLEEEMPQDELSSLRNLNID
ncbi:KGK domain-containing protein [Pseudanabaena yagii]|jgi:hypothetical protein|uniref:KGK domain-containing protein n=1 Tax=Pseudanabaena yagii GIHE-NHR1 TaxID=2722753 RepID=A0ABX1LTM3_9CYAN|nr:KGK domain-containing protein [Pseudanabaena yagii]NMF59513.1 hypothetical protein [Pseudanabaena yagii GIHE-NHR1]